MFDDLLAANVRYRNEFHHSGVRGIAAKGLAVLTCIDSRIDPLAMLGLREGDAKILRNAGARVSDDALRSLILAVNLLGVNRVCVVHHTDCAMTCDNEEEMRIRVSRVTGIDASDWNFLTSPDHFETLRNDIRLIHECPLIPDDLIVGGFMFDVRSGELTPAQLDI